MDQPRIGWTDQRIEQMVGNLLRVGVVTAAVVILVGAVLFLSQHGTERADYAKFQGEPHGFRNPLAIIADAFTLDGASVIQLGVLLLLATPVARVALSVVAFALVRDRLYVVVSLIVLAVLLYSLVGVSISV